MNLSITPSAVAVDTAANLLEFLELARDPAKLKAVISQIKSAQDAAKAEVDKVQSIRDDAAKMSADAEKMAAKATNAAADAAAQAQRAAAAIAEADAAREAMRDERNKFDNWMAGEREALAALRARADSDADANKRVAADLSKQLNALAAKEKSVEEAKAAADAARAEYEQKLASLKAMVS
jgi:colicin import membrane protein